MSSEITGGKFKNGASTAAFSWVLARGAKAMQSGPPDRCIRNCGQQSFSEEQRKEILQKISELSTDTRAGEYGSARDATVALNSNEALMNYADDLGIEFCAVIDGKTFSALSDELAYTRDDALEYLRTASNVYEVVKVGGMLSYNEFKAYMDTNFSSEEEVYKQWKRHSSHDGEHFLLIRNYRGDYSVGSVFEAKLMSSANFLQDLGEKYIIFLRANIEYPAHTEIDFHYGDCDIFPASQIPRETKGEFSELVKHLSAGSLPHV